jgi:hypothetical protein
MLVLAAYVAAVGSTPGSAASFNDSAPCPASGPLLVCPMMHVGQAVQLQLLAHDGCDVYRWEIVNGALPGGLSMSSTGVVSGTPTKAETTEPWIWVHDVTAAEGGPSWCGGDNHSERQFVFSVDGPAGAPAPAPAPAPVPAPQPALQITTSNLPKATAGASYTATLAVSGASSGTWTIASGALPDGVTLGSGGALSGTPTSAGTYTFTVRVDAGGRSASKQFQLVVVEKLSAAVPAAQTWEVGRPLHVAIDVKGGTPGYSWKLSGALPAHTGFVGDQGNGSTSYVQGVPAEAGTFPIVLTVTDSGGVSMDVSVTLTVAPKLQIQTFRVGTSRLHKSYRLVFASAGGVGEAHWAVAAGALPSGLKLDSASGVLAGTPLTTGRFRFTIAVTDALGAKAGMTYTLRVKR